MLASNVYPFNASTEDGVGISVDSNDIEQHLPWTVYNIVTLSENVISLMQ